MEFNYIKPFEAGISSKQIKKYLEILKRYNIPVHSIIMAKGNNIFFEKYWEPFTPEFQHRLYSSTKSFVSIAIGFLLQEGLIKSLDDKITDYFKDDLPDNIATNVKDQTIRNMLMMSTGFIKERECWFEHNVEDRVKYYFEISAEPADNKTEYSKIPGSFYFYDSNGSFILGSLVERLSGMSFKDYLTEKLFSKLGITEKVRCLSCPGGNSWSDSALLCTPMTFLKTARFVLNYGKVDGVQLLSEDYLRAATSRQIDCADKGVINFRCFGYGYQFIRTWNNSFFFNGAGANIAICVPEQDIIMVFNADTQGEVLHFKEIVIDRFFEEIIDTASDYALCGDEANYDKLMKYCEDLKLCVLDGEMTSDMTDVINGVTYTLADNPMGIKRFRVELRGDEGELYYTNAQGDKVLKFGLGKNVFDIFPQCGYSREVANKYAEGNYYKCASSAAWRERDKLCILVQVIDDYFGKAYFSIKFISKDTAAILVSSAAEDFFKEYKGYADTIGQ